MHQPRRIFTMTATRRRAGALAVLCAAAMVTPPVLAAQQTPPPALSLESALAATRERNPDLLAQRNDIVAARAATRAARADFIPSASAQADLGYTASGVQRFGAQEFGEKPAYYSSGYYLGINYEMSGAKLMQPRIARAQERATDRRITGYEAGLVSQVSQQYITALQAGEQVQQAEREVARTLEHERLAKARLEVGTGTPLDVRRAEVDRGRAEVAVLQRKNDHATQLLRLGQMIGTPLSTQTRLTTTFVLSEPRWTPEELVAMALNANPDLAAARANTEAARTTVRAARTQYLPSVSFSAGYRGSSYSAADIDPLYRQELQGAQIGYAGCTRQNQVFSALGMSTQDCGPNPALPEVQADLRRSVDASNPGLFSLQRQPLSASLTFSLPIFNGLQRERRIEEARVQASDAELGVRTQELRLRTEVESTLLALRTAYATAQLQEQVVSRATDELRLAQERFRYGLASSVEVTDAQTSLAEAERGRIDAVYNYHKSLAALEALVGQALR
jgi:outer membrane protein